MFQKTKKSLSLFRNRLVQFTTKCCKIKVPGMPPKAIFQSYIITESNLFSKYAVLTQSFDSLIGLFGKYQL